MIPTIGNTYVYSAPENLAKYNWIIANGEIISSTNNLVEVKWNKEREQTLILRYQTFLGCSANINIKVDVKEDVSLAVDELGTDKTNLSVGPNPNNGQFSIDTSLALDNCKIAVFNVYGQKVYSESNVSLGGNIKEISIPNIQSGVYVLIVTHKNNRFDFKMIID
ncbi:T9SS type A sorting domain-containing protein [Polaribacter atrinae]|uniref:T9SS type A sorting domain-containing protein n=1 Tax=Polaribacter atrinae TaxID=1333662 RepID=UPI0030F8EE6B